MKRSNRTTNWLLYRAGCGVVLAILTLNTSAGAEPATVKQNLAPNGSFEEDAKRMGGWTHVGVMPDDEVNRLRVTTEAAFDGERSLRIEPGPFPEDGSVRGRRYFADYNGGEGVREVSAKNGVVGARTIALRLTPNVASIESAIWVRRESEQPIVFTAVWTTRRGRRPVVEIHRDVVSDPVDQDGEWEKFNLLAPRPAHAIQVQLVVETSGTGLIYLDAVELYVHRRPEAKLLVNQVGYEPQSKAKRVVLQSTQRMLSPAPARIINLATFQEVTTVPWKEHGYVANLDYYYWTADFSTLTAEGDYLIALGKGSRRIDSDRFAIRANLIRQLSGKPAYRFYYEQRCGTAVPGVHAACHLDDGRLPDGSHRDLTGGWHDAGDYNKYNGLAPEATRLLSLAYHRNAVLFDQWDEDGNGLADVLDEAEWGAQWLEKMLDAESLELLDQVYSGYRYWGAPEKETDNRPGSGDDRPVRSANGDRRHLVAAFAWLGMYMQQSRRAELAERGRGYVALSVRLAKEVEGDLLSLYALHHATGQNAYLETARRRALAALDNQSDSTGRFGELARFAIASSDKALRERLKAMASQRVEELRTICPGPFQAAMRRGADGTLSYCRRYEDVNDWYVGETAYRLEIAVDGLLAAGLGVDEGRTLAEQQLNWIFGCNPAGVSMMEGLGSRFVPGYHHRYNAIPGNPRGAVTGALLNGFVRAYPHVDRPWLDLFVEPNSDYHANEPWLLQNNRWLEVLAWW